MKTFSGLLLVGCSALALASCGPSDIASPGAGGVVINNPPAAPAPPPVVGPATVVAAGACPTIEDSQGLVNRGTINGPTGNWRVCELPRIVRTSSRLRKIPGLVYSMAGRVDVGCDGGFTAPTGAGFASPTVGCGNLTADTNVTLTIDPGVIVVGTTGDAWLAVNRGNKLNAVGTATQPIIFTSDDNVAFTLDDANDMKQWGGVVLMGRARVTDCNGGGSPQGTTAAGAPAADTCERAVEGATTSALFGGRDNTYNAGTVQFVQFRYSGFPLSGDNELQAFTTGGTGTGTVIDHIHAHNSSDDGIEIFGGAVNAKYLVVTGADDDSFDVDKGVQGNFQHVLLIQRDGYGDSLVEVDDAINLSDLPRTNAKIANFTMIQRRNDNGNGASIRMRGNADLTLANGILVSPGNECVRLDTSSGNPTIAARSVVMQCAATKYIGDTATLTGIFGAGNANGNSDGYTPTLASLFINGSNENALTGVNPQTLPPASSFFDTVTHVGAVRAGDTWYQGWTCNSSYANFGGSSGACNSLPTT